MRGASHASADFIQINQRCVNSKTFENGKFGHPYLNGKLSDGDHAEIPFDSTDPKCHAPDTTAQ
jgi:hypothetical protein